jgi:type VI secretion system secreted protein VgrG
VLPGAADSDKAGNLLDEALVNEFEAPQSKAKRTLNFSG